MPFSYALSLHGHVLVAEAQVASRMAVHEQPAEPASEVEPATHAEQPEVEVDAVTGLSADAMLASEYVLAGHARPHVAVL